MRLKLDENIPVSLVADLEAFGLEADTCRDEGIQGKPDEIVARCAANEDRILVTFDVDFADIRRFPPGTHPGIVVLRIGSQDVISCRSAIHRALETLSENDILRNLVIVEETRVRIRRAIDN